MPVKFFRLIVLFILTGSLAMSHAVIAGDVVTLMAPQYRSSLVNMTGPKGFVTQLLVVDRGTLVEQLSELRSLQIARKQELANLLQEKKFDTTDMLIALVMPGGLVYAGYKKAAYARTRNNLDEVSKNIAVSSSDLEMLREQMWPIAVAQLK